MSKEYKANLVRYNVGDKLADSILGTNIIGEKKTQNDYELQKAVNINKYSWNQQGMLQAGINPLAATSQLGGVSSSQATSDPGQAGFIVGAVRDLLHEISPGTLLRDAKEIIKSK